MHGLPLFIYQYKFSAPGYANPFVNDDAAELAGVPLPMQNIPSKWSLQVTGLAADGKTNVAATAWSVSLQGSLDGIGFDGDTTAAILSHVSGTNADGAVVKSGANFSAVRFARLHCTSLTISPAASILVSVVGSN